MSPWSQQLLYEMWWQYHTVGMLLFREGELGVDCSIDDPKQINKNRLKREVFIFHKDDNLKHTASTTMERFSLNNVRMTESKVGL